MNHTKNSKEKQNLKGTIFTSNAHWNIMIRIGLDIRTEHV